MCRSSPGNLGGYRLEYGRMVTAEVTGNRSCAGAVTEKCLYFQRDVAKVTAVAAVTCAEKRGAVLFYAHPPSHVCARARYAKCACSSRGY